MNRLLAAARRRLPLVHFGVDSVLWVVSIPLAVWLRYDYRFSQLDRNLVHADRVRGRAAGRFRAGVGPVPPPLALRQFRRGPDGRAHCCVGRFGLDDGVVAVERHPPFGARARNRPVAARSDHGPLDVASAQRTPQLVRTASICSAWSWSVPARVATRCCARCAARADSSYLPVALLDDDPHKRNLRLSGVRVEGRVDDLESVASKHHADAVLVAVPSADSSLIRRVSELAAEINLRVLVLPPVDQLLGGVGEADIRPVNELDLLGRHPADIDPDAVAHYISGRRVLVTGAGGSIGSELCRQLARFEPARTVHVGSRRERSAFDPVVDRGSGDARRRSPDPG